MPDPYNFPPGDQPEDDPVRPAAGPDGGEQGSNEHGAGSEYVQTVAASAQGGGVSMATPGTLGNPDPELSHDVVVTAPTITSFTPSTGTAATSVTITGTNLDDVSAVTVNGVAANLVSQTKTSLVFTIAQSAANGGSTGKIELRSPDGSVQSATDLTVT